MISNITRTNYHLYLKLLIFFNVYPDYIQLQLNYYLEGDYSHLQLVNDFNRP